LEAALVRREFLGVGLVRCEQFAEHHGRHADAQADEDEQQHRKIFCEHKVLVPTSRLELLRLFRPLAPQASVSTNFTTWAHAKLSPKNHRGTSLPDGASAGSAGFCGSAAGFCASVGFAFAGTRSTTLALSAVRCVAT